MHLQQSHAIPEAKSEGYLLLYFHPQPLCIAIYVHLIVFHVAVTVSVPSTASFSEDAGTVQVCVTLDRMSVVPIGVTVTVMDGKYFCIPVMGQLLVNFIKF